MLMFDNMLILNTLGLNNQGLIWSLRVLVGIAK